MKTQVIANLYDAETGTMKDFTFDVVLDIHKLTPMLLNKARYSKSKKASVAFGALTIHHIEPKGFISELTAEQKAKATSYRGEESYGDEKYKRQSSLASQISAVESGKIIER